MAINYKDLQNNTHPVWHKDPGMRRGMFHIIILYFTVYSLGYDGSLLNGLQALPAWQTDLQNPRGTQLGLIAASYYLPKIPLAPVFSILTDRYGRRFTIAVGVFFMIAGAIVCGFSYSPAQFIGARVLLGIGTVAANIGTVTLIPELAHPRMRHFAGSFLLTTFYIGSILSAWITFAMVYFPSGGSWAWRIPALFQGAGPIVLGVGLWWVPESPRWLIMRNHEAEAHKILATYHANGQMDDELVLFELSEIKAQIEMSYVSNQTSWMSFVNTAANRRRIGVVLLIGLCTQLSGNGVVQYYLVPILRTVGITAPPQTAGINGGLAIFNWFVAMAGASLVERFGRRPLFLFSLAGQLFCFIMLTGLAGGYNTTKIAAMGVSIVPFIFLQQGFYSSALTPLPLLYVPEILPSVLRAKGVGLYGMSQNVAQTFNQFVNPVALEAIGWQYYGVYVAVLVAFLVGFYFTIKETRGLTVEEAAVVFEDEDKKLEMIEAERRINAQTAAALEATTTELRKTASKSESVEHAEYKA